MQFHRLDGDELLIGPEIGDIPAENHEIQGILGIDVGNAPAEIRHVMRSEGEMIVGNEGKTDRFFGIGYR